MATIYETGHAKNVANLESLISFCTAYGTGYNPTKANIQLAALNTLLTDSRTALTTVIEKVTEFNNAVNKRSNTFKDLKKLSTKLVNAISVTDASDKTIEDAKGINRKIQGTRASKKTETTATATDTANTSTPDAKTISSAQMSYDQTIEHLAKFISLLKSEPSYNPNENELKISELATLLDKMKSANTDVINAYTAISNARIQRNETFYNSDSGIYESATETKKYIKSVFGSRSPQYNQIRGLLFKKVV